MGGVFRFKEFEVDQRGCAMKINTDAVLLATMVEARSPLRALDIGSGTGVIALMLAQRFPAVTIDAVDIDELAFLRTKENFENSKFFTRMHAYHGDFEIMATGLTYDLIVSNPPFYVNALHNPDGRKKLARHADLAFFERLLHFSECRLSEAGSLQLIVPVELAEDIKSYIGVSELFLEREISIRSFAHSESIRKILIFRKGLVSKVDYFDFIIYQQKGMYSDAYKELLKPFFLAF